MRAALAALVLVGCWREAPPCDQPGYDAVAETCRRDRITVAQCAERLREHTSRCTQKIEAE